ncbi:21512_t:CDS:2, partial [Gigaspora margarita]
RNETHKSDLKDGIEVEVLVVCKNLTKMDIVIGIELDELNRQEEEKPKTNLNALDESNCKTIVGNNNGSLNRKSINESERLSKGEIIHQSRRKKLINSGRERVTDFLKHNNSSKVEKKKNTPDQIWTLDIASDRVVQG